MHLKDCPIQFEIISVDGNVGTGSSRSVATCFRDLSEKLSEKVPMLGDSAPVGKQTGRSDPALLCVLHYDTPVLRVFQGAAENIL